MPFEIVLDYRPLWAVLISLVAAALILISGKYPNLREFWTILAALGKTVLVFSMVPAVLSRKILDIVPFNIARGISLHLSVDAAGLLFAALASFLWVVTSFYSIGYMRALGEEHQTGYFASFAVCLSATMGIAFAGNLLTFFVFYEILTVATYPLVIHHRNGEAIRSGRKYLAYTLIAGQLLLIGVIWVQMLAGGGFRAGGFLTQDIASPRVLGTIFFLMISGVGVKAGVMPLHGWLPSAMVAPTPVSALLHAVAVVKAGAFGILRIIGYVFGPQLLGALGAATVLSWLAAFTIIVSSLIALRQDNLKRRLAFSTIGQLSYVVLGISLLTPLGLLGGMFHITAHAFMKITLFFCAGAIYATAHKSNISEMAGLGRQMPLTFAAFALASLGIAGVPFFAGFISKWNIALGALQAGQGLFIAVLIASALLSTSYFIPVVYMAFFKTSEAYAGGAHTGEAETVCNEAGKGMLVPLVITALFSVALGIAPNFGAGFYNLAALAAQSIANVTCLTGGW